MLKVRQRRGFWLIFLSEVYLQIIGGKEKLPFLGLMKNLPILLKVMVTASARIRALVTPVLENPHLDPAGHHLGHVQMILGLLFKIKKKRDLALQQSASFYSSDKLRCSRGSTPLSLSRVRSPDRRPRPWGISYGHLRGPQMLSHFDHRH
jgi:hypothetical protein